MDWIIIHGDQMFTILLRALDGWTYTEESSTNATKNTWLPDNSRMLIQIKNSIDHEIFELVNHSKLVKDQLE